MTIEMNRRQAPFDLGITTPVRIVDTDVHPSPKFGELGPFVPEPFRSRLAKRAEGAGSGIYYDAPDFAHAMAMRVDSYPDDGNFAGSDPDLLFKQLIMEAGSDIAILGPTNGSPGQTEEEVHALAVGTNLWQDQCWLDSKNNWHKRFRGSIVVAIEDPQAAAREIETWAGHEYFSQVLINAEMRPAWGDPRYDVVWAAAAKHDIPVACHLSRGRYNELPMSPVGFMTYNHDLMVSYSMLAANQVMSLIFDGVFDRFPDLKIVFIEHAFNWILPLMWRMDAMYARHGVPETNLKRKPSEYVKSNIWFTTQPLDYPEDKLELTNALNWMEADKILLFSSDYPHWTFDDPQWVAKHMPEPMRDAIMFRNGLDLFHLPEEVPALPGQKRAY
ncbi:amidohydrolase family protein [Rhodococcus sp. BP-149]|uniref:amidohydrolase family protein n=1 Tax=unclassified Rhodococcus (in: high G+C Gram-positive bacteria) TaxID=192944 RepID=UPI001C9A8B8C|nr:MULTISPECIES: amidohydrolase family protein [unclassified Rhodococcus (in: high G+C Gram-positive bacteria)]MBY6687806.1 amidohydrolase family protein [Rhodococcus sp. BP-288]MBY6696071.1 amidohydrolase family protein [Rhodococcus sp. BP-188]MBY6700668.1 amidohydrolase family protein [Rhodococcus sp. BP-285]MBY6705065.1 amidohydrolase family protein [Rhodococcus sp. BP-283]MBY6713793.1 amidohydrolase family protein [Rhodococcus sp. BP-160]